MSRLNIYANEKFLLVQPCAGLRRTVANHAEPSIFLQRDAAPEEIGEAVLNTLQRYKVLGPDELATFYNLEKLEGAYRLWVQDLLDQYNYPNKKALFKNMKHCHLRLQDGYLAITPTKRRGLEAWVGTGQGGQDEIHITEASGMDVFGRGVLLALKRCI
jgi:hypothetical protein